MNLNFKSFLPHVIVAVIFLALAFIYAKPILDNKVLYQYDIVQSKAAAKEVLDYKEKTGEYSLWTNSMFGGMPAYTVVGKYPQSLTITLAGHLTYLFPEPVNVIFYLLIGFYIMMVALRFNPWVSAIGAIGFAFSSYNLISLEAGHISKVLAVAYAPPIIAGAILVYRGKYFLGTIITSFFLILELYAAHFQISYYLFIALLIYVVIEFFLSLKEKRLKQFLMGSVVLGFIAVLGVGSMASKYWTTMEYSQYSIRGASELKSNTESKGGLDRDYAFSWSYGIGETFTFLVPNFYGGQSQGELDSKSEVYQVIKSKYGVQAAKGFVQSLPLYWGGQPNTGGPAYMGAIIVFLFILSMFVVKNPLKWWVFAVVVLFTMLSWGKNFSALSYFFFDYFPLYNKFRAVTMIHSLVALMMSFMAAWGVKEIVEKKLSKEEVQKYLKISGGVVGGILLVLILLGSSLFSFEKLKDKEEEQSTDEYFVSNLEQMTGDKAVAQDIYEALLEDRASLMRQDAIRSFIFIALAAGLLWFAAGGKLQKEIGYAGLIFLVLIDLWSVDKRFLSNDDFIPKKKYQAQFNPDPADEQILNDPDPHFRVMNQTVSTFNDATTSYFHKSIGGYSAAKMRRYQDLIEKHISQGNMNVLNMLNTKYIIQQSQQGGKVAARNPGALGNAWLVDEIKWVQNADEEIEALKDFRPERTAVIDTRFKDKVGNIDPNPDSASYIRLQEYQPDKLVYESNTNAPQLAVFSEIYYNNELGWEAFVDGNPQPHFRVNYILRGMVIPQGKHKIEFRFEPKSYYTGERIALICSVLLFGIIIGCAFIKVKKGKDEGIDL